MNQPQNEPNPINSEKLTKRLAIFYHPLFQSIIKYWTKAFMLQAGNVNMIGFIEVNLRIQKAMLSQWDFYNSLSSALTDWLRELENLADKNGSKIQNIRKVNKKEKDSISLVTDQLNSLTFEASATNEKYQNYLKANKTHHALKYADFLLSVDGFGKFLFDLCQSWCEDLDIELYCFFLLGLMINITNPPENGIILLKKTDDVKKLPTNFSTQMKQLRNHFNRYQKVDLNNYKSWYEWNYMPFRLQEMKTKVKELLLQIYPEDQEKIDAFDTVFQQAVEEVEDLNLSNPTTEHFGNIWNTEEGRMEQWQRFNLTLQSQIGAAARKTRQQSPETGRKQSPESTGDSNVLAVSYDPNQNTSKHAKFSKRVSIPIIGKHIDKPPPEKESKIVSIKNLQMFVDEDDEDDDVAPLKGDQMTNGQQQAANGLYPIWEHEFSECNSTRTMQTSVHNKSSVSRIEAAMLQHQGSGGLKIEHPSGFSPKRNQNSQSPQRSSVGFSTSPNYTFESEKATRGVNTGSNYVTDPEKRRTGGSFIPPTQDPRIMQQMKLAQQQLEQYKIFDLEQQSSQQNLSHYAGSSSGGGVAGSSSYYGSQQNIDAHNMSVNIDNRGSSIKIEGPVRPRTPLENPNLVQEILLEDKDQREEMDQQDLPLYYALRSGQRFSKEYLNQGSMPRVKPPSAKNQQRNASVNGRSKQYQQQQYQHQPQPPKRRVAGMKTPDPIEELDLAIIGNKKTDHERFIQDLNNMQHQTYSKALSTFGTKDASLASKNQSKIGLPEIRGRGTVGGDDKNQAKTKIDNIHKFNIKEYENLFPEDFDPVNLEKFRSFPEYFKKVEELKEQFHKQFASDFIKSGYMLGMDYKGMRHDMGGVITEEERQEFFTQLEKRFEINKKKMEKRMKRIEKKAGVVGARRKRFKTFDAEKKGKTFLNKENRSFFKNALVTQPLKYEKEMNKLNQK